ncbi:hypothetical protein RQP46_009955 [Phenoliferia psychrophenolica]
MLKIPFAARARRGSHDVFAPTHRTLKERLELLALSNSAISLSNEEAVDSGYASDEDARLVIPIKPRRRSTNDDSIWVKERLSMISMGLATKAPVKENERASMLRRESAALAESLNDEFVEAADGTISVPQSRPSSPRGSRSATVADPWRSSTALARRITQNPEAFGASNPNNRTLELGAGSGVVSLVWKAVADLSPSGSSHLVVATDFHQRTLDNLSETIEGATPSTTSPSTPTTIISQKLDWKAIHQSLAFTKQNHSSRPVLPAPLDLPFDTILASDVVYDPSHALHLHSAVEQFLVRPPHPQVTGGDAWEGSAFWLAVPLLASHNMSIQSIETTFARIEGDGDATGAWFLGIQSFVDEFHGEAGCRIYHIGWC